MSERRRRSGYTLIEILLALAIVALVGALVLPGLNSMLRTIGNEEPDRILWDAITAAREDALNRNHAIWLRFDEKEKLLLWGDGRTVATKAWPADTTLQLLEPSRTATALIGGQLVETQEVKEVKFYADGTCDPFRAQIRVGTAPPQTIGIDPWTCAPVLRAEDKR
jgi:prepilin-type N-terminal cleavage/methylation domain-containing protein